MMQIIRDKAHGIFAWTIIGLIILSFCTWGVSVHLGGSEPYVAKVYGKKITVREVDQAYNNWLRVMAHQKNFDISKIDPTYVKGELAKSMASEEAVLRGLQNNHFGISDKLLAANIQADRALQVDGKFSIERFKALLAQAGISEALFEQLTREKLILNQAQQSIIVSSFQLKSEVEKMLSIKDQTRDFAYGVVSFDKFNKTASKPTEAAMQEYYEKNKSQFVQPEKVKLEYIDLSVNNVKNNKIDEKALQEYYKNNAQYFNDPELYRVRHIMVAVPPDATEAQKKELKAKIDAIYSKLKGGADFATLAKSDSEDKMTAIKGGDLGWVSKNDQLPAQVYLLTEPNQYTEPVKSDFGWHIFQMQELKKPHQKNLADVRDEVESRYKQDMASKLFSAQGEELANLTYENPKSLLPASEKLNLPIQTTDFFTRDAGEGIASEKAVRDAAFSDDVLEQQHNSSAIRISDDSYVVIRVKDRQPQKDLPFADVKDRIAKILQEDQARIEAKRVGSEMVAAIKSGTAPDKAASKFGVTMRTVKNAGREEKTVPQGVLQQAFLMPKPEKGEAFTTHGFQLANGNFIVVTLYNVTPGKVNDSKDSFLSEKVGAQLAILQGRLEFALLQAALVKAADVKYVSNK